MTTTPENPTAQADHIAILVRGLRLAVKIYDNPNFVRCADELERLAKLEAQHAQLIMLKSDTHQDMLQEQVTAAIVLRAEKAEAALAEASRENIGLRAANDKRIEEFLAERMCCNGQDCGCMGVTRLQQYINEAAGEKLTAERALVQKLREALASAPSPVCTADDTGPYDGPHKVRNFAAVDRWWVVTRSAALALTADRAETEGGASS